MTKIENKELSHKLIEKSLEDVSEILKSVFGENVQIDVNVNGVAPEKVLQAYGLEASNSKICLSHKEHSMSIYTDNYLPFECKKNSFVHEGIIE